MPLSFVSIQLDTARVELVGPACGGLRRGEIPETAARGELAEEIGLRPSVHFYFIGRDDDLREFERVMQGGPIRNRTRHLLGENLFAPCFGQRRLAG
jgi:8-oxo-dGTP pyrophosphatase MutT (NUDIX family)